MTVNADTATDAPASKRRRRGLRALLISLGAVLVLALAALGGAGWYFSGEVINVDHGPSEYGLTVLAVDADSVTLPRGEATEKPGTWGLAWEDGQAVIGEVLASDEDTVTRALDRVLYGDLAVDTPARIDTWTYRDDPQTALGLAYEEVAIPTELGDAPAWQLAGEGTTWVVTVHGRNASPAETLRGVEVYAALGYPVLAVTHRNDEGAPAAPDGLHSLGEYESDDVVDAVEYALDNGAEDVVLHGWSMGGAIVSTAARKLADTGVVKAVVLDSPVMDWNSTLDMQAADRDVIDPITWAAKRIVEWRADIDLDDLDQRNFVDEFDMPMLLFVDTADETVDHTATLDFAERLPEGQATVVTTASGHTASWNEDPAAYGAALTDFLASL
ncbi:alpha/beta hydrolase family protein [Glycomyces paridis]|uniref:Alpha/beta hydrolase n=1 Tax=Glycomyces paridis TaxID=2126555 RepID=A0A4S8PGM3_9ACTN|nr:alpha/beta fold hydrolase [Glycomyces paridis]THV29061.1 alpha/beta hydrolase [Glycomyces paridis]